VFYINKQINLYKMGSKIISISLTDEDADFLDENKALKPSLMLREKIESVRESRKDLAGQVKIHAAHAKKYQDLFLDAVEFITQNGLGEKWKDHH